uniref:Uncharacterized protein n=1 Tax=Davidia involucrata TaxID=16924 RepID=A0A5B7B3Z4_DAVIN
MGRKIPVSKNPSLHPILSLWLLLACIAATIATISSLCGALSRKKSPPPSASQHITTENSDSDVVISPMNEAKTTMEPSPQNEEEEEELPPPPPPPPGVLRGEASYHFRSNSTASQGRLSRSMSMRVQGGGRIWRQLSRREERHEKKRERKLNHEDSIWKKTIILGGKCRVPDDEDDAILYDEKGNRISTYHPRTASSLPVSRQTSFIDPDAIPNVEGQEKEVIKKSFGSSRRFH